MFFSYLFPGILRRVNDVFFSYLFPGILRRVSDVFFSYLSVFFLLIRKKCNMNCMNTKYVLTGAWMIFFTIITHSVCPYCTKQIAYVHVVRIYIFCTCGCRLIQLAAIYCIHLQYEYIVVVCTKYTTRNPRPSTGTMDYSTTVKNGHIP